MPWYPPLLGCLVLGGLAAQPVMLAALFRRTTGGWLAVAVPAAADGEKPAASAGVGWTDDR